MRDQLDEDLRLNLFYVTNTAPTWIATLLNRLRSKLRNSSTNIVTGLDKKKLV